MRLLDPIELLAVLTHAAASGQLLLWQPASRSLDTVGPGQMAINGQCVQITVPENAQADEIAKLRQQLDELDPRKPRVLAPKA